MTAELVESGPLPWPTAAAARFTLRRGSGRARHAILLCAALSVLLRIRFLFTPLTADEGGFLAIARAWMHGADLYEDIWVDRPQGLLALFAGWDRLSGGHTQSIRLLAMLFGVAAVLACAAIAKTLAGWGPAVLAALFVAVLSSAPAAEGFLANGELLSGTLGAVSLAVSTTVVVGMPPRRRTASLMAFAGVMAGLSISVKQSGIDGYAVMASWLLLAMLFGWRSRRWALAAFGWLTGGLALVVGLLMVHGALTGWDDWYFAFAGYRLASRSALDGADWGRFWGTMAYVSPVFGPVVIAMVCIGCALVLTGRARRLAGTRPEFAIPVLWLLSAGFGFLMGGQFFRHYWIILSFPVATCAALVINSLGRPSRRWATAAAAVIPALCYAASLILLPRVEVPLRTGGESRLAKAEQVGAWFRANHQAGDSIYVLCSGASVYAHARSDPPYPYLWHDNVLLVPGAVDQLFAMLSSETRPTFVARFQSPRACGLRADQEQILTDHYRPLVTVAGAEVLVRTT